MEGLNQLPNKLKAREENKDAIVDACEVFALIVKWLKMFLHNDLKTIFTHVASIER